MLSRKIELKFYDNDFVIGEDFFEDISIIDTPSIDNFWYFSNRKKGLIKKFILEISPGVEKICEVKLIKKNGKFTPRFDFSIWNKTKKALEEVSKETVDQNLIKSRVSLDSCYENFLLLLNFLKNVEEIDFGSNSYAVIDKTKKEIFDNVTKEIAIDSFVKKYGSDVSEQDIVLLQGRRQKLDHFNELLTNNAFFESERQRLGINKRKEDVWQNFFENNSWIFGYGLQLVACEGLDDKKLEQIIIGNDVIDGSGKRIDALLKTKGNISKILFCEIKTHLKNLLVETYDRPGVFVPGKELRGAVAQIQKTIYKATLKINASYLKPVKENGDPTGEELLFVKPRGIVIIGQLNDFKATTGINYEMLSSFELYRQQISGIEILTYDELFQRIKFIVEDTK